MSDPRVTPDPDLMSLNEPAQIARPVVDLIRRPGGPRDRQLLFGADVHVLHRADGWVYVQANADGYCGFVQQADVAARRTLTHKVTAPATHAYRDADIKSPDQWTLSHGSRVAATDETDGFIRTAQGHIPKQHIAPLGQIQTDPAEVAALYLGTPYLWGGNSRWGIDCSGLVQAACLACGIPCPGDSDLQELSVGQPCDPATPPQRNDLMFWKGHVAMVWDADTILHANAHAMATVFEPLKDAITRIQSSDGPVTAHRRLVP